MEELEKTKSRDPNAKTLIFSQFVNFLDLIEWRLRLAGTANDLKSVDLLNSLTKVLAVLSLMGE